MDRIYRALADPTRRRILRLLAAGERTQSGIVQEFAVSQPAIVKHLRILKSAGLIRERREGRWSYYHLEEEAVAAAYGAMRLEWETLLQQHLEGLKRYVESRKED